MSKKMARQLVYVSMKKLFKAIGKRDAVLASFTAVSELKEESYGNIGEVTDLIARVKNQIYEFNTIAKQNAIISKQINNIRTITYLKPSIFVASKSEGFTIFGLIDSVKSNGDISEEEAKLILKRLKEKL
jgi:hypothetical protein